MTLFRIDGTLFCCSTVTVPKLTSALTEKLTANSIIALMHYFT
ncbi:hypothetical protein [Shewanella denitrificans]|nr:hypothetical protein [Shewanella denitrificans]